MEKIKQHYEMENRQIKCLEYDEKDEKFPEKFIQVIKQIYPKLNADITQVKEFWLKATKFEDFVDPRK